MDDSWRMPMGPSTVPIQPNNQPSLDPNDFHDVFGGPPRTVLSRQFSVEGRTTTASLLFEDIFRNPSVDRTLPEFRIPASKAGVRLSEEEFYSDIFGNSRRSRSRSVSQTNSNSKSKSNSSSILSSEELSPFRPAVVENDDVSFSSFAAKLRPINVSSKWNTSKKMSDLDSPCNFESFESDYMHKFKGCYSGFTQRVSSPEITTFGPNSYASVKESNEDLQVNSPASVVSSLNQDQGDETSSIHEESEDDDDDEVMSSYVIEINPGKNKEKIGESDGVDEAIAWAKQKCKSCNLEKEWNKREVECPRVEEMGLHESSEEPLEELEKDESPCKQEELEKDESLCKQMELELLDEDIKLWSDGKESNIRLLLATLHHILWPSSGWVMIQLKNLKDSSSVKKAYQKARLCLHPDKLQQRNGTISQKYVAEKAFPILQDAWAAFISQDVCSSIK